jgi:hypothetical protein
MSHLEVGISGDYETILTFKVTRSDKDIVDESGAQFEVTSRCFFKV